MKATAPLPYQGETFLNGPKVELSDLGQGDLVVIGVPWDKTKVSRRGAVEGPTAIREATFLFDYYVTKLAENELVNIDDGQRFTYRAGIQDAGDLDLASLDTPAMMEFVRETYRKVGASGAVPVSLGGDHFTTFPVVWGFTEGIRESSGEELGYLHIDLHLDLCGEVPIFGKYSSGSTIRNLFEEKALRGGCTAIIGAEPVQMRSDIEFATANDIAIHSITEVHRDGPTAVTRRALDSVMRRSDGLYVSLDIDCLNRTFAPGTGNAMGVSGLLPDELMEILDVVREYPIRGLDVVEVAPAWDPTERTQNIAAAALIEVLEPRLFEVADA
jgi:arginase family enzyme